MALDDSSLANAEALTLWTIGHSTRALEAFLALLAANAIECVADVRRYPGSRAYPHFGQDILPGALGRAGIDYEPFPELGGRRRPRPDTPNTVWRNVSFRGYADYMESEPFRAGIARLLSLAAHTRVTLMCSEAVWWRCHRALIADFLKAQGVRVLHIMDDGESKLHPYTAPARVQNGVLSYPPPAE